MKILILGGTRFIGRHIAETLLASGHAVSILARGKSSDELPDTVERLRGDRNLGLSGLDALTDRRWDICVDVSGYTPLQVRASTEKLRACVGRYVFVSAVSVYGDPTNRPVVETHPQLPPASEDVTDINGETYGPLKVACENIVREVFADRCSLLRPQIVVGPHDPTGRYSCWVRRATQSGEMLAPGDGSDHVQFIDVRDLARFTRTVIENELTGPFNAAGHRLTWANFIKILGAKNVVWIASELIRSAGITESELPLYRAEHGPRSGLMDVSNNRARAAGLTLTDPKVTVQDMRAWIHGRDQPTLFSPDAEATLIQIARQHPGNTVENFCPPKQ